MKFFS